MHLLPLARRLLVVALIGLLIGVAGSTCLVAGLPRVDFVGSGDWLLFRQGLAQALLPAFYGLAQFTLAVGFRAYAEGRFETDWQLAIDSVRQRGIVVHGA